MERWRWALTEQLLQNLIVYNNNKNPPKLTSAGEKEKKDRRIILCSPRHACHGCLKNRLPFFLPLFSIYINIFSLFFLNLILLAVFTTGNADRFFFYDRPNGTDFPNPAAPPINPYLTGKIIKKTKRR